MKRAGSVSIWAALSLLLLLSVFFTAAEGVCAVGKRTTAQQALATASEGILAGYCLPLWETYGILAADPFYGKTPDSWSPAEAEARLAAGIQGNLPPGFFSAQIESVSMQEICLLQDHKGAALVAQCAAAELASLGQEGLAALTGWMQNGQQDVLSTGEIDAMLDAGTAALEEKPPADAPAPKKTPPEKVPPSKAAPKENPIEAIRKWKENGVLSLVLPADEWPGETPRGDRGFAMRTLFSGTAQADGPSLAQTAAFRGYLADRMSCYTAPKEGRRCPLETEYILFGKSSDRENLEAMVWRLIGLREVQNLLTLAQDSTRQAEAEAVAASLAAVTANPAVIKAVQAALLAAWAFLESVLDVRLMLAGGEVPLQKTPAEWTSDITQIAACMPVQVRARPATGAGLSYRGALLILLGLGSRETLVRRTLETMEYQIRGCEGYEHIRIDGLICGFTADAVFRAEAVFPAALPADGSADGLYLWEAKRAAAYQKTK